MADELIPFSTPTTMLEAVNRCLLAIGEAPVSDLTDSSTSADVESAFAILQSVNREVQVEGWNFNTEERIAIAPNSDGHLVLPEGTLRVDSTYLSRDIRVVMRGARLYDRRNHTYVFSDPVVCDLVVLLSFEELPEYARRYITIRAVRQFSDDEMASDTIHKFKKDDEDEARIAMEQFDVEDDDTSLKDSPHFQDMLLRGRTRRMYG